MIGWACWREATVARPGVCRAKCKMEPAVADSRPLRYRCFGGAEVVENEMKDEIAGHFHPDQEPDRRVTPDISRNIEISGSLGTGRVAVVALRSFRQAYFLHCNFVTLKLLLSVCASSRNLARAFRHATLSRRK